MHTPQDDATKQSLHAELLSRTDRPWHKGLSGGRRRHLTQRLRGSRRAAPRQFGSKIALSQDRCFAIVGDLQRKSRVEIWRQSNGAERAHIIRQIAQEAPDFLAIVGDLVFCGSSRSHWAEFDHLTTPLHEAAIPVLPLLGNHEYWLSRHSALTHFFARFPHLEGRHWYSKSYGQLGLIFLDSNVRCLRASRWQEQIAWYRQELERFEHDQEIAGVLVMLHHPPYTNSPLTPDGLHVQRSFVPAFMQARKTLAMISGHVHSYERFERTGKTFLVTGGGGPRIKLATGHRRRHLDDLFDGPSWRHFHFLRLTLSPTGLKVEMRGLREHESKFETLDCFTSPWVPSTPLVGLCRT
jgi:Icc-related predicted phosphoesterase